VVPWLAVLALAGLLALVDWRVSAGPPLPRHDLAVSATAPFAAGAPGAAGWGSAGRGGPTRLRGISAGSGPARPVAGSAARLGAGGTGEARLGPVTSPASAAADGGSVPDAAPAMGAVAGYFRSLAAQDAQGVLASSDEGPLAMAGIVLDSAAIDAQRGATTTMALGPSSLAPVSESQGRVVVDGALTLTTTVSGPEGSRVSTDTFSGPLTVSDESGSWRVTGFTYDGRPVEVWDVGASETVDGLTASLGYVVSFGNLSAALVTLRQASGHADVQLQRVTLAAGASTENGTGDFTGPPVPSGVLRFARLEGTPSSLDLEFSSPAGAAYAFSFSLP
jgi:hypothetical protein